MRSLGVRRAIILAILLRYNLSFVHGTNMTRERTAPGKVARDFFKAPWINLEGSWKDKLTGACRDDIVELFDSADDGEMWALKMLDASSKIPSGILTGNIYDLGMYDECIRVESKDNPANIQGRHCMVSLSIPSKLLEDPSEQMYVQKLSLYNPSAGVDLGLTLSVCLPSSCGIEDVEGFVNASIDSMQILSELDTRIVKVTCSKAVDSAEDLPLGTVLTLSFYATIVVLQLFSTLCGFIVNTNPEKASSVMKTIAQFSIHKNVKKLLSTELSAETIPSICGVRALCTCSIVVGHRLFTIFIKPVVNLPAIIESRHSVLAPSYVALMSIVDTFFVLAGFFTTYGLLKKLRSGKKINVFALYFHRYLRLTPCVAVMILFSIYIMPYLGSGPNWDTVIGSTAESCRRNWWANLLYVQNFVNKGDMCMLHTWYLAVEMHLYWICPMVLLPLHRKPQLGLKILGLFLIAAFVVPAVQLVANHRAAVVNINSKNFAEFNREFCETYPITYNRLLPYLVGILLGYDVVNNKRQLTTRQVSFNWILAAFLVALCIRVFTVIQPSFFPFNILWEVMYVTVVRLAWSIVTAWILYAITQGYGGPLTKFLSLPIFIPISRLSYCIYLVHFLIQIVDNAKVRTAVFYTAPSEVYLVGGDLALSIVAAFFLNLIIETPVAILENILGDKRLCKIRKLAGFNKNDQTFSTTLKGYFQLTRGRVPSDSTIKPILSRQNTDRQVIPSQSQNRMTAVTKKLSTYFSALKCGPKDVESFQEFEIRDVTGLTVDTCGLHDLSPLKNLTMSDSALSRSAGIRYPHQENESTKLRNRKL